MVTVISFRTPPNTATGSTSVSLAGKASPRLPPASEPATSSGQTSKPVSAGAPRNDATTKSPARVSRRRFVGSTAAAVACKHPEWAEAGDANLIALCEQAIAIESAGAASTADPSFPAPGTVPAAGHAVSADWDRVVNRLSLLPARTWPGLQAKARLIQLFSPSLACGKTDDLLGTPEENLVASLVRDVLRAK